VRSSLRADEGDQRIGLLKAMALVIAGVTIGAWELAAFAAAVVATAFVATEPGREATREAAREAEKALERLRPSPPEEPDPKPDPRPPPIPPICQDCGESKGCPPCSPPVGTIAFEVHRVPPQDPHHPCPGDHVHFFERHQNPNNCQCFWKRNALPVKCLAQGEDYQPQPGEVPL
jgi:hypothetical protein